MSSIQNIKLDQGNCVIVRLRGEEAYVKDTSLRTGTVYKAGGIDELAQHSKVLCSVPKVKTEVVYRNNTLLPGEALLASGPKGCNKPDEGNAQWRAIVAEASKESAEDIVIEELRAWSSRRRVTRPVKTQETRIR